MAIKLIVTDLDGTFFDSDHITIPERNIEAFKKAHEAGIKTAVASGRPRCLTNNVLAQIPFIDYLVTSNGAVAYDLKNNKIIAEKLIDNAQALKIFEILDGYDLPYEIYYKGNCHISAKSYEKFDNEHVPEHFIRILKEHLQVEESLPELIGSDGIEKINVMSLTPEQRSELEAKIRDTGDIYITSSVAGNMEMNHKDANKGFAVRSLAEDLNIGSESVMCFGDGENDSEMLAFAEFSFAMENGSNYAKRSAKFITSANNECGVAKAVERYALGL